MGERRDNLQADLWEHLHVAYEGDYHAFRADVGVVCGNLLVEGDAGDQDATPILPPHLAGVPYEDLDPGIRWNMEHPAEEPNEVAGE